MELPFDKHIHRRRLYLMRHAQALDVSKGSYDYPTTITLTDLGRQQAEAMREHLSSVAFDWTYSSDVQRSIETAGIVLQAHPDAKQQMSPLFAELKTETHKILAGATSPEDGQRQIAYYLDRVGDISATELEELTERIEHAVDKLLGDDWRVGLLCAHSIFNRFFMCRLMGLDYAHIVHFEQDYACLNILDLDIDESGKLVRCVVRAMNVTPYDHTKSALTYSDGELVALSLKEVLAQKLGA